MRLKTWRSVIIGVLGAALIFGGEEAMRAGSILMGAVTVTVGTITLYAAYRMLKHDDRPEEIKRGFD